MILFSLILLSQPTLAESLRERIEAEATEIVSGFLADAIETTLLSEGREPDFSACVGRAVAKDFEEATDEQREDGMRAWIHAGKRQCELSLASANASRSP